MLVLGASVSVAERKKDTLNLSYIIEIRMSRAQILFFWRERAACQPQSLQRLKRGRAWNLEGAQNKMLMMCVKV